MLGVAIRAQHLALRELGENSLATPPPTNRIRNGYLLRRRIGVMELKTSRMGLAATRAHKRALEIGEPLDDRVSSGKLGLSFSLDELGSSSVVLRALVPRSIRRAPLLRILCRHDRAR